MAHLTVTYVQDATAAAAGLSSPFIPAYPEYYTSTTFDAAFYTARTEQCEALEIKHAE
jgi:hypothetical protein